MQVWSNNPKVMDRIQDIEKHYIDGTYLDVLLQVRDKIHQGYCLLIHPLYGSIKPNQTPYRTLLIEQSEEIDLRSVVLIEEAIEKTRSFLCHRRKQKNTKEILDDYQEIDWNLIEGAVQRL